MILRCWQTSALARDYRRRTVHQRCIGNEQQRKQHRTYYCKKSEHWHFRVPIVQKEIPFRIIRPKKTAVSDKPNTCAVTRSLVFVITCIPAFRF